MYNQTDGQAEIHRIFNDTGHKIFVQLTYLGLDAYRELRRLPHTNEQGERVQHGANNMIMAKVRAYFQAAQALAHEFNGYNRGREYFPYMVLRHWACAIPLPEWMEKVIENNKGDIPLSQAEVTACGGVIYTVEK